MIAQLRAKPSLVQSGVLAKLEALHIPVVFVDYELHPVENTLPSIALLGKVLGQNERAHSTSLSISSVWICCISVWPTLTKNRWCLSNRSRVSQGWIMAAALRMPAMAGVVWSKRRAV
jgi:hypothetical protein